MQQTQNRVISEQCSHLARWKIETLVANHMKQFPDEMITKKKKQNHFRKEEK